MKFLNILKDYFKTPSSGCNKSDCYQGRNCSCGPINFSEAIIAVHALASRVQDTEIKHEIRLIGDRLAQIGNAEHERQSGLRKPEARETFTNNSVYNYDGLEGTNH